MTKIQFVRICRKTMEVADLLQMEGIPPSHQELKDRGLLHEWHLGSDLFRSELRICLLTMVFGLIPYSCQHPFGHPCLEQPTRGLMAKFHCAVSRSRGMFTVFVSHQWLSSRHPDPHGQQLKVLRLALQGIVDGSLQVEADPISRMQGEQSGMSGRARKAGNGVLELLPQQLLVVGAFVAGLTL